MHNACTTMSSVSKHIQIRNVPEEVHAELTARAALAGQSLQEFLLGRLIADAAKVVNRRIIDETRQAIRDHPDDFTSADVTEFIRIDRESH